MNDFHKRLHVYPAKDGWRWRKWSGTDIVGTSGESYASKQGAIAAAKKEVEGTDIPVEVLDQNPRDGK